MLITLTTDFGYRDPFAGVMKGVVLSINPEARIVDITHGIAPQNIAEAAFVISGSYRYFPQDSIHVVVVDPGVGSGRRPIAVEADGHYFIGPDNGVFTPILDSPHEILDVFHITAEHYFLPQKGATFQGRDVFAPVAAWLSRGVAVEKLGEKITDYVTIPLPEPLKKEGYIKGEVVYIDGFGNAMTNIPQAMVDGLCAEGAEMKIEAAGTEVPLRGFYSESLADAEENKLSAVINSNGRLELFLYRGSASAEFKIKAGDPVVIVAAEKKP